MSDTRRRLLLVGVGTVVVLVAATLSLRQLTAGSAPTATAGPSAAGQSATGQESAGAAPPPGDDGSAPDRPADPGATAQVVQWTSDLGPLGGAGGVDEELAAAFQDGSCDAMTTVASQYPLDDPLLTLAQGGSAACRVVSGDATAWPDLVAATGRLDDSSPELNCLLAPIYKIMEELVALHARYPDATITRGSGATPCPRIAAVTPDHGSRTVDTEVTFTGVNLPQHVLIHVGRTEVDVALDGQTGTVTIPAAADPADDTVAVWPDGWPFEGTNTAEFRYDD